MTNNTTNNDSLDTYLGYGLLLQLSLDFVYLYLTTSICFGLEWNESQCGVYLRNINSTNSMLDTEILCD